MPEQELQRRREEEEKLKKGDPILALEGGPPAGGSPQPDARSLDDLLSFIDGSADKGANKGVKKKRGKGGRKQPQLPPPLSNGHGVISLILLPVPKAPWPFITQYTTLQVSQL